MYLRGNKGWTPLHTRLISHRIGDGTANVHGYPVWDNKNIIEFVTLAKTLDVKIWKPVIGDKYGTYKIVMPKGFFAQFADVCHANAEYLIKNPVYLLRKLNTLSDEHRLQTLAALIVDDGCCTNWTLVAFEDQNKDTVECAYRLWKSLFGPSTAKIKYRITPMGTKVYRIVVGRDGIVRLYQKIELAVKVYGPLAGLWWKQDALKRRYCKATSDKALKMKERKNKENLWQKQILNLSKNQNLNLKDISALIGRDTYTAWRVIKPLIRSKQLYKIGFGRWSYYSSKFTDKTMDARKKLIGKYLQRYKSITNREARKLLGLGLGRTYVILKSMATSGELKQIKSTNPQATKYILAH